MQRDAVTVRQSGVRVAGQRVSLHPGSSIYLTPDYSALGRAKPVDHSTLNRDWLYEARVGTLNSTHKLTGISGTAYHEKGSVEAIVASAADLQDNQIFVLRKVSPKGDQD